MQVLGDGVAHDGAGGALLSVGESLQLLVDVSGSRPTSRAGNPGRTPGRGVATMPAAATTPT